MSQHPEISSAKGISSKDRACILAMFVLGFLGLPFLGALPIWLWRRRHSGVVDVAGRAAMNLQLSVLLYGFGLAMLLCTAALLTGSFLLVFGAMALGICWGLLCNFMGLYLQIMAMTEFLDGRTYLQPRYVLRLF